MKFLPAVATLLAVLPATLAVDQKKSAVVYFVNDQTPDSVIDEAIEYIKQRGGIVTHIYHMIKAFAVEAPQKALDMVQTMDAQYPARVEEDEVVTVQ